jgi:hypothetical protein
VGSISSPINALTQSLNSLAKQITDRNASQVKQFQAYVQGKDNGKIADAQYIEDLRPNQDRLNLFSTMSQGNDQNFYKFNLNYDGKVNFSMLANLMDDKGYVISSAVSGLDVQVLQMHGSSPVVVADNDPKSGANYDNFAKLQGDGLDMTGGKYAIKVTRDVTAPKTANFFYSFQLAGDRYYQDFDTIEAPAPKTHGESVLNFLKINAVVGLMADSVDTTTAMAGQAMLPVNGASLTAGQDNETDPAVRLLSMFA